MSVPWGDVATAWVSTGIPDIEVFMAMPAAVIMGARLTRYAGRLLGSGPVRKLIQKSIDSAPAGPDAAQRAKGSAHLWGQVRNASGQTATSRLHTVDGYALTAMTAWDIAKRSVAGHARPGFQTPSLIFGADYILGFKSGRREDL